MKKLTKIVILAILIFSLVVGLSLFFVKNINKSNDSIIKNDKYLIIGKNSVIAVYEEKLAVRIPFEIQIDKEGTLGQIVEAKDYNRVLDIVNRLFPEKIEVYKVIKLGNVDFKVKNAINIPETIIDEKRYILTSSINPMFKEFYKKNQDISYENISIDILNGNGKSGYARKIGQNLKEKFKLNYNAATYAKEVNGSYLVVNNIPKEKVEKIFLELSEKYISVKEDSSIASFANLILVLGDDKKAETVIEVYGMGDNKERIISTLKKFEYNQIKDNNKDLKIEDESIEYSKEDYYTAYKIGERIGVKRLIENNALDNIIKINVK